MRGRLGTMQQMALVTGIFLALLAGAALAGLAGGAALPWLGMSAWRCVRETNGMELEAMTL